MIEVTIKSLDGRNSEFQLEDEITVEDFKKKIESELNIPVAQQRLIFQGRVLRDESKLQEYDVQNKVIHLVPRPPPSAQREQQPASADETGSSTTSTGFMGSPWGAWGGVDMQQAIQDITSGIFTGLGELGRSAQIQIPAEADFNPAFPSHASLLAARENTFNRLHRQATHLLRRIVRHPLSPSIDESEDNGSPEIDESAPASPTGSPADGPHCATVGNGSMENVESQVASELKSDGAARRAAESARTLDSPMNVDPDPEDRTEESTQPVTSDRGSSAVRSQSGDRAVGAENQSSTEHPLSTLADMLARHRRLWRSAEPYLDRWETMLNNESRMQQTRLTQSNVAAEPARSSISEENKPVEPTTDVEQNGASCTITLGTDSTPTHGTVIEDASDSLPDHNWQHRFFLQISRLLHLHAHMLHLISDFNVISITESSPRTTDTATAQDTAATRAEEITRRNISETHETTATVPVAVPDSNALPKPERQSRPYPRRILNVPETETQYIRTSINVEPVGIVNTQPPASNATLQESRSRVNLIASADRRRSQSASVALNDQRDTLNQETQPAVTTTSNTRPTGVPVTTSVRGGPGGTERIAIVHRLDIPVISMNMINLPLPTFFERLVPPTTNAQTTTATTTVSTPSAPVDSVVSTAPSFSVPLVSEAQMTVTAAPANPSTNPRPVATPHVHPIRAISVDPFLTCSSRHFAQEHGRANAHHTGGVFTLPLSFPTAHITQTTIPPRAPTEPRTADVRNTSNLTQAEPPVSSVPATDGSQTTTTTTSRSSAQPPAGTTTATGARGEPATLRFPSGFSLPQQIASFVSAATSAAASAATASGLHMGHSPFNVLVSSTPMQFTIDASRLGTNNQSSDSGVTTHTSGTTTSGPTAAGAAAATAGHQTASATDPMHPFTWLFGRNNPLLSAVSMTTQRVVTPGARDPSRVNQSRPRDSQASTVPVPAWADVRIESAPADLTDAHRILTVFTEALVETVWAHVTQLAATEGVDINALSCDLRQSHPTDRPMSCQRISAGFLRDIISTVQSELPRTGVTGPVTNTETVPPETLDGVRTRLSQLLLHADTAVRKLSENNLTDGLINVIFNRCVTDGDVSSSSNSLERRAIGWMCQQTESDSQVVDVRASLARMFRMSLSSLLDLWRNSPINFGFGSVLLTTLSDFCVYTICMLEVLATQLTTSTRLITQPVTQPVSVPFHLVVDRLRQFADTLGNADDARLCRLIAAGFEHCISTYSNYSAENLRTMRDHSLHAFVVRRSLAARLPMDVEMGPRPSQLEQCEFDEADLDDLPFEDASSDLPITNSAPTAHGTAANLEKLSIPTARGHGSGSLSARSSIFSGSSDRPRPTGRGATSGNISPLPDGTPKPGQLPESISRALDPHPDSARSLLDASTDLPNPEGWHAVLPAEWLHVVAGDVATMERTSSTIAPNTPLDQLCRFSDAYIAGMPAKRRKVMEEHSRSMAQPPDAMLAECLSDAIRVSGCRSTHPHTAETNGTAVVGVATDAEHVSPKTEVDLALSLRDLVSERIAARLSTDPDFDSTQFPLSHEAFVKKRLENH